MKIVYLKPKSSFRDTLRSDTLWGLLCWGIRMVYSEKRLIEFIEDTLNNSSPLKISSSFKYLQKESTRVHLFPRPILKPFDWSEKFGKMTKSESINKQAMIKKFKKIKFLPETYFLKLIKGEITDFDLFNDFNVLSDLKLNRHFREIDFLHNTINRLTGTTPKEGGLYTKEEVFSNDAGLFFLMSGTEEQIKLIQSSLNFFSDFGFGGDSSIGKNRFEPEVLDFNLFNNLKPQHAFISLSLYNPTGDDLAAIKEQSNLSWYEYEIRKGKIGGQFYQSEKFWKKSVTCFREGSVFPDMNKDHYGKVSKADTDDLNPQFVPYHFGLSFNLPIKI